MALKDILGSAMKNIRRAGWKPDYIGGAMTGAMWGAGIGGARSAIEGGSFVEGAKSGAFTGAVAGAGWKAFRAGRGDFGGSPASVAKAGAKQVAGQTSFMGNSSEDLFTLKQGKGALRETVGVKGQIGFADLDMAERVTKHATPRVESQGARRPLVLPNRGRSVRPKRLAFNKRVKYPLR